MAELAHRPVAQALHGLHEEDQHQHHGQHDFRQEALVAVADAQITQPAAANGARHGRVARQTHEGNGQARHNAGQRLGQQHLPDDLAGGGAHGLGGLDQTVVHLTQGRFHQSGHKGRRSNGERYHGGGRAD